MFGTEMKTNNGKRLIAAAIALAMIVCALAFVATPSEAATTDVVDGSDYADVEAMTTVPTADQIATAFETEDVIILAPSTSGTITEDVVIPAGKILIIGDEYSANSSGAKITFNGNVTVNGTLYNNLGDMKSNSGVIFASGSHLSMGTTGVVYSTCAFNWEGTGQITGFFTNSNGALGTEYKHIYAGNINSLIPYVNAVEYSDTASTAVKAIYTYGDVTISQNAVINDMTLNIGGVGASNDSTLTIAKNATLTINANATVKAATNNNTSEVSNNGTINLYGTADVAVDNSGTVRILSEDAVYDSNDFTGTGSIDTSAISNEGSISGTYGDEEGGQNVFNVAPNQIVTVTDDLTLVNTFQLNVKGTLIIPEGVIVTIQDTAGIALSGQTASIENNGTIIIESKYNSSSSTGGLAVKGGSIENNGTVSLNYLLDTTATPADTVGDNLYIAAGSFTNNGTLTVGNESAINVAGGVVINGAEATFTMNGKLSAFGVIENSGDITINGISTGATISLAAEGASVQIVSLTSSGSFVVNNDTFDDEKVVKNVDNNSGVAFSVVSPNYIGGITITSIVYDGTYIDENNAEKEGVVKGIDLAGTVSLGTNSTDATARATGIMTVFGQYVNVTDNLTVGGGLNLNLGHSSRGGLDLAVSGTMTVSTNTDNPIRINAYEASAIVTGQIVSAVKLHTGISGLTMNAAMYSTTTNAVQTYYYTTLANAIDAGVTPIDIYGSIEVTEDVTIPNGTTVRQNGASEITVSEDVTLTVANGGSIVSGNVAVNGTLYIEVANTGFRNGIAVSDVYSTDGTDARYTNLVNAMNLAESGDTIKLYNQNGVTIDSPLVIKEGVTLDTDGKNFTVKGTTLTINGTLYINGANNTFSVVKGDATETGYQAPANVVLNGYIKSNEYIAYEKGTTASPSWTPAGAYYTVTENGVPGYFISTVANGIAAINDAENDTVTLYGKLNVGNVSVTGTDENDATVAIANGADVTGNFTLDRAVLSVAAGAGYSGTVADANGSIIIPADAIYTTATTFTATVDDEGVASFTVVGYIAAGTEKTITVTGEVTLGNVTIDTLTVDGTASVVGGASVTGTLTVNGTVDVEPNGTLTVNASNSKAVILGDLNIAEATATTAAGSATITTLYVGIGFDSEGDFADSTAATVTGAVQGAAAIYVSASSTIPEALTTEDDIEFFIEGDLWMTFYGTTASVGNAPVQNAKFEGWSETDGGDIITTGTGSTTFKSSFTNSNYDVLYAIIDYNVYNITIRTDGGIASVAVDGVVLSQGLGGSNQYRASNLAAGEHTVTYTIKTGYQGEPTLSSENVSVSGLTFTISGDFEDTDYLISLTGTSPVDYSAGSSGNNGDDGLGLTDYLLIILVVLIVIMAIMVAMRLMRS